MCINQESTYVYMNPNDWRGVILRQLSSNLPRSVKIRGSGQADIPEWNMEIPTRVEMRALPTTPYRRALRRIWGRKTTLW